MASNTTSLNFMDITVGNDSYLNVTGLHITALTSLLNYTILNSTGLLNLTAPSPDPTPANASPDWTVNLCVPNSDMAGIGVRKPRKYDEIKLSVI